MMAELSKTQQQVLRKLQDHAPAVLVRRPGGFWTWDGCPADVRGVPAWWVTVQTVRALERLGVLERTNRYQEEWLDSRQLKGVR